MARSAGVSIENAFSKGLITEVTGVNSPENSVTSSANVIFDRKGRASKRRGFLHEVDAVFNDVARTGARNEFVWETVLDNNQKEFTVVQFGSRIRFFSTVPGEPLSAGLEDFLVYLPNHKLSNFSNTVVENNLASFASGGGYLFIAHPNCVMLRVEYDVDANDIIVTPITIKIRDFEGVEDNLEPDTRPSSLSTAHKYNLYNQGWYATVASNQDGDDQIVEVQALDYWLENRDDIPSNTDVWWHYTTTGVDDAEAGEAASLDRLDTKLGDVNRNLFGNAPASKGHYIINAFGTNRSTLSGIPNVKEQSSNGFRCTAVAFFAGRAFYGGVGHPKFSANVYFSQIAEEPEQYARCYQASDPTSKENFDLVASDGGVIKIQEINTILAFHVVESTLYVFATNGVWSISGSDNGPFKATDYTVTKVSSYPAISSLNIVDVGGLPIWWNHEGIFALTKAQAGLVTEVTNLSRTTIQSFYDAIPQSAKLTAKGCYNDQDGIVVWLYNVLPAEGTYRYTNILVLDAVTQAFYPFTIPTTGDQISGVVAVRTAGEIFEDFTVRDQSLNQVVTSSGLRVVSSQSIGNSVRSKTFKYLTISGETTSFAEIRSITYLDWGTENYEDFFITGHRVRGELLKKFQTNYLTVISEEQGLGLGSAFVQGIWDYSTSDGSGKYTNPQQVYRHRLLRAYQQSKVKIRGNGRSLQFKFYGEQGRPYVIVGWAGFETANAQV